MTIKNLLFPPFYVKSVIKLVKYVGANINYLKLVPVATPFIALGVVDVLVCVNVTKTLPPIPISPKKIMSKNVKECQRMSKNVKECERMSKNVKESERE